MLKESKKKSFFLAESLVLFFSHPSRQADDFLRLHNSVTKAVRLLVSKWHLRSVVSEEQISETVLDFIEELSDKPSQSRFCARIFAEIRLKSRPSLEFIEFYSVRRLFTILKQHADSKSHEYLRLDRQIKKTLKHLVNSQELRFARPDFFAAQNPEGVPEITRRFLDRRVLSELPLRRFWSESGKSIINKGLKTSLKRLLLTSPHDLFKFRKRLISSVLFNLTDCLLQRQLTAGETRSGADAFVRFSALEEAISAKRAFAELLKAFADRRERFLLIFLGIGYFYNLYPHYFRAGDIIPRHLIALQAKGGQIDRIHAFLEQLSGEQKLPLKWKRTTVHNRLSRFKGMLRSVLSDCSALAAQKFLPAVIKNFLKLYHGEFGENNE